MTKHGIRYARLSQRTWLKQLRNGAAEVGWGRVSLGYTRVGPAWRTYRPTWTDGQVFQLDAARVHYVHDGAIEFRTNLNNSQWVRAGSGDVIFLSANVPHEHRLAPNCRYATVTYARMQMKQRGKPCRIKDHLILVHDAQSSCDYLEKLSHNRRNPSEFSSELERGLLIAFFADLFARANKQAAPAPHTLREGQRDRIERYVTDNLETQWITPPELAKLVTLSDDYFRRLFKATYELTPQEWLKRRRIEHAAYLLRISPMSISEIGYALGYNDLSFFGRQFREVVGCSAREYRRRER